MKYRTKPTIKEAIQWTGKNLDEVIAFTGDSLMPIERRPDYDLKIKTLEGVMIADKFDWIIKGVKGEFYPCKPDIFEMTYEAVE
jgi:hypothetical protein